jgi:DNA-binding beta-propeller fold protein YncE
VEKAWGPGGHDTTIGLGDGSVWIAFASGPVGQGLGVLSGGGIFPTVLATDKRGAAVSVGGAPSGIAITADDGLFVSDASGGGVIQYVSGATEPPIPVGGSARGIAFGEGSIWVSVDVP